MKKRVAIQGIAGSYHDIAARSFYEGGEIEIVGCNTFRDVITTIKKDPAILGLMAIENTIAGSLLQNHELIRESGLRVIGEYKLRISHSLVALPGTTIHDITEVNSHPIALMQCGEFLKAHPQLKAVERDDTAGSAAEIAERRLTGHAAICGRLAAERYGLEILEEGIETNKRNFTRFLLLADRYHADRHTGSARADKASLSDRIQPAAYPGKPLQSTDHPFVLRHQPHQNPVDAHYRLRMGVPLLRGRILCGLHPLPAVDRRDHPFDQRFQNSGRIRRIQRINTPIKLWK